MAGVPAPHHRGGGMSRAAGSPAGRRGGRPRCCWRCPAAGRAPASRRAGCRPRIGHAFANLYALQQVRQGNPRSRAARLHSRASCQKGTQADAQEGAGRWVCTVTFLVAGPGYPVVAKYNVHVQTDGCYAADGDGPASVNGSPTITGPHFTQVDNPLRLIDGCFDTT